MAHRIAVIAGDGIGPEVTVEALWSEIDRANAATPTPIPVHSKAAIGPIMRIGQKNGWIQKTGSFKEGEGLTHHRAALRLWISLIYRGVPS